MSEITQKLNAWNMSDGTVQIHATGCQHKPGSGNAKALKQDQVEFGQTDWTSQHAFAYDYWNNGILNEYEAEHGEGSFDVFQEMDFKPCVTLPMYDPTEENTVAKTDTSKTDADKGTKAAKKELPGKAPNEVPAPRSANSKALPGGLCRCGCGTAVGRTSTFAQGHDARFVSKLVQKFEKGEVSREDVLNETGAISDPLKAKADKAMTNAVDNLKKREEAKTQKDIKAAERAKAAEAAKAKAAAAKAAVAEAAKAAESAKSDGDLDLDFSETEVTGPASGVENDEDDF